MVLRLHTALCDFQLLLMAGVAPRTCHCIEQHLPQVLPARCVLDILERMCRERNTMCRKHPQQLLLNVESGLPTYTSGM
jgi:hypothetical protein